ncbi:hypothetical protein HYR99_16690 [Candidatus Poribacteria bacterium]|nr:hypothetical protein [Candidatus Poribacteria bacterium]
MEEYDPATDTWTKKSDMPTARGSVSTSAVNGKIYTIGGDNVHDGPPFSTVEEYDTGFVPQSTEVSPQGKLATLWGKIKQGR